MLSQIAPPEFWRLPEFRQCIATVETQIRLELSDARGNGRSRTRVFCASCNSDAFRAAGAGTPFAVAAPMRGHHEATSAIVSALAMVIPVAGALWARAISLQPPPAKKSTEAGHERET